MTKGQDDLGDARSRHANARHREMAERRKAAEPEYAYAPRWVPMGNWRASPGDLILLVLGLGIILGAVAMRFLGYF